MNSGDTRSRGPALVQRHAWLIAGAVLVLVSIAFVVWARMTPGYDAYGWLVWGRQVLHWNLDTNGAPSWKPLTFLFTLPYSLVGRGSRWLWMITAVAGALSGSLFAGRIAYKLTGAAPGRRYAPIAAAVFAGLGVLGIDGYWQQLLIANSDPMDISLCLAAIDCQLSRRPRLAFVLLELVALGRPEAWPFVGLYALWAWRAVPSMRVLAAAGVAIIPVMWFSVPALTSRSWLSPGDLALHSMHGVHGSKIPGVIGRFLRLNALPIRLAALFALVLAVVRRDRAALLLAGAAFLWVAIEIAFALHGFSAVPRYLAEPAAVVVVLAGTAVGRVLAAPHASTVVRWVGAVAAVVLIGSLFPAAQSRVREAKAALGVVRMDAKEVETLEAVIRRIGGVTPVRACGQPVGDLGFQSVLAWEFGLSVGKVGFRPGMSINQGHPIVLFKRHQLDWTVRTIHTPAAERSKCDRLRVNTAL